jgi:hypothetical protein
VGSKDGNFDEGKIEQLSHWTIEVVTSVNLGHLTTVYNG